MKNDKLLKTSAIISPLGADMAGNPWSTTDVDKMELNNKGKPEDLFHKLVDTCRFFYRKDPIVSSTINKMVDIGITELQFTKYGLSDNEYRIFEIIEDPLQEFAESMALEYLLSGLVIPEVKYATVGKDQYKEYNVKKYTSLILPVSMNLRDPCTIKINSVLSDEPSYYVEIPEDIVYFIMNNGRYPDGNRDFALYQKLSTTYPDLVLSVKNGAREMLLENNLIFRRRVLTDSPYPTPFLSPAIEPLKHKRNLRRMDYAVAARVIGAIQLFKLGDKDFPVIDGDEEQFEAIRNQMYYRDSPKADIEKIFQLFANHTLQIEWIVPPTEALLNETKYKNVNDDIIFSLGFPRILITGESERTGTSNPEFAMLAPVKTMENFRQKIEEVLQDIVDEVATYNNLKNSPDVSFKPLQLNDFKTWVDGLVQLYNTGNISRSSFTENFGYTWEDEVAQKSEENKTIQRLGVETFAPQPFSPQPQGKNKNQTQPDNTPQDNGQNSA